MSTKLPAQRGYFDSGDGLRLYAEHDPLAAPRARLLLVHGFADHCARYRAMSELLNDQGYACHRFDLRGHGRSEGKRGHIYRFDDYLRDFAAFRAQVDAEHAIDGPTYILAHSYGALIAASAAIRSAEGIAGMVLSSPFLAAAIKIPAWKRTIGELCSKYLPAIALPTGLPAEWMSHDPATIQEYGTDPLIGRVASARWLTETEAAQAAAIAGAGAITVPVLVQQAAADRIVSVDAARRLYDAIGSKDKTWTAYDGLYHEIWFEKDREPVYAELRRWLADHIG
ncbi:MAG: lysophospholipase [Myxococcales bacterium]|nr:lysophospholipase [Myxococcales bacterium]MCB9543006.1 lysophospholipase [Myxococcales bacterium]MCB9551777.1 lysophospholipase [Myxococcales bacterium]